MKSILLLLIIVPFNTLFSQTNSEITINALYFNRGNSFLTKESKVFLNKISFLFEENPKLVLEFSSHSDCRGPELYNLNLSKKSLML